MKLIAILTTALMSSAHAASLTMPFNGCTVYKSRLLPFFDTCAQFSAVTGRNGCTKVKGVCPACVTYSGDHLEMWLPDFLVEVTPHIGRSVFAENSFGIALRKHLSLATSWWNKSSVSVPLLSNGTSQWNDHAATWHVRVLPVPFGSLASTFPPLKSSRGVGVPVCYSSLSELNPAQWQWNSVDLPFALALSPIALAACYSPIGAATSGVAATLSANTPSLTGAAQSLTGLDGFDTSGFSGCALPVPAKVGYAKNMMPSSDIWNPQKLCIGTLGALLPRVGTITSNEPFKSALLAAVKFASLTGDHFGDRATGGWDLTDKWQLIYPPSPQAACFRPGTLSQAIEGITGIIEDSATRAKDNVPVGASANVKSGTYIFAVWRRRETCQEPLNVVSGGAGWQATYQLNKSKNLAICSAATELF